MKKLLTLVLIILFVIPLMGMRQPSAPRTTLKSWFVEFTGTETLTAVNTNTLMPGMSLDIVTNGGPIKITGVSSWAHNTAGRTSYMTIYVDGSIACNRIHIGSGTVNNKRSVAINCIKEIAAGFHTVEMKWETNLATLSAFGAALTVHELDL